MDTPLQWWRRRGWGARILVILIALYLLYVLAVFFVLPGWLRDKSEAALSDLLGRPVSIERLALNPLTLSATVENFAIADPTTETLAGFQRLYVNAEFWAALFHWRPWIGRLELDGLDLRLFRAADGTLNVEDIIAHLGEEPEQTPEQTPEPPPQEADKGPPALTVAHLSLSNGALRFTDAAGEEPVTLSLPVAFTVEDLTTRAPEQRDNRYELHIEGPDGGTLDWDGRFELAPLATEGHLRMTRVDLVSFAALLEPRMRFRVPTGQLALSADYQFSAAPGAGLRVENGRVSLRDLRILPQGSEQATLVLPELSVQGLALSTAEQTVLVPKARLSAPSLRAVRGEQGIDLATLFLPRESSGAPAEPAAAEVDATTPTDGAAGQEAAADNAEDGASWRVELKELAMEQGEMTFRDETLATPTELHLSDGVLTLTDLIVADDIAWHWSGSATLAGSGQLRHSGEGQVAPLKVDAKLKLADLPLAAFSPWIADALPMTVPKGKAHADLALNIAGEAPSVRITGSAGLNQVALLENGAKEPFARLAGLNVGGLNVSTGQHSAVIGDLAVAGLILNYDIDAQGNDLLTRLIGPAEETAGQGGPAWRVRLDRATVKDSRLSHHDASLSPPFQVALEKWNASLKGFDTAGGKAAVEISGRVNGNAPLKAKGSVDPDPLFVDLTVSLNGYGMDGLTPYTGHYLGYAVQRGVLSMDTKVKIENRKLDSDTSFSADRFFLGDTIASEDAISVPVKLGLSVLRDASGMIQLPLDVSGDMSDPSFSVAGLIFRVIRNVLVKAATAPFSLLAGLVGGEDLERIGFPAGDAVPSAEVEQSLAALAKLLRDRPELNVEITGQTAREDRQALARAGLIEVLGGDWPGLDEAVADDGFFGYQGKILKQFERRFEVDRDTLAVEGDDDRADTERARQAWERLLAQAIKDVDTATLMELATARGENARRDLIEKQQLDESRLQQGTPVVDGDVAGIKLGLGND